MSEIQIIPYKSLQKTKRKFLLSFSIFRMEGPYRNFDKYFNSLKKLLKESHISDCDICIFIDNSVFKYKPFKYWLENDVQRMKHVFVLQYICKDFLKPMSDYHYGTFGSIMRLYALTDDFATKYHKYDATFISDVDMQPYEVDQKFINEMIDSKASICYRTRIYYNKVWAQKTLEFPIMIGTFISSLYFPLDLLTTFLYNLKHNKYTKNVKSIIEENISKKRKHIFLTNDLFVYGLDEYFANRFLIQYYLKLHKKALIYVDPIINKLPYLIKDFESSNKIKSSDAIDIINSFEKLNKLEYKKKIVQYYIDLYEHLKRTDYKDIDDSMKIFVKRAIPYISKIDYDILASRILIPINVYDSTGINNSNNFLEKKRKTIKNYIVKSHLLKTKKNRKNKDV